MIVSGIGELTIVGVFDRGVPNFERIAIQANQTTDLGKYGIMLGVKGSSGQAFPIRDNLFWFGDGLLPPNDWLFLYTGPGEPRAAEAPGGTGRLISLHWGRDRTVLHSSVVVPILFRIDAVQVAQEFGLLSSSSNQDI